MNANKGKTYATRMEEAGIKRDSLEDALFTATSRKFLASALKTIKGMIDEDGEQYYEIKLGCPEPFIIKADSNTMYYNGKPIQWVWDRGYRFIQLECNVVRAHHILYFAAHPYDYEEFCKKGNQLVINHMVCEDAKAFNVEGQNCLPTAKWEYPKNLEMISQSQNRLHGEFYNRLALFGYRVPAGFIGTIEYYLFSLFKGMKNELGDMLRSGDYNGFYKNVVLSKDQKDFIVSAAYKTLGCTEKYYWGDTL